MRFTERIKRLVMIRLSGERGLELTKGARRSIPNEVGAGVAHTRQHRGSIQTCERAACARCSRMIAARKRYPSDIEEGLQRAARCAGGARELLLGFSISSCAQEGHPEHALRVRVARSAPRGCLKPFELRLLGLRQRRGKEREGKDKDSKNARHPVRILSLG